MFVAPLTGAWIEIRNGSRSAGTLGVAPLAGAWIEIAVRAVDFEDAGGSPPSRGAWIEIEAEWPHLHPLAVAPLAGGVD